jgi:hypothetical protein
MVSNKFSRSTKHIQVMYTTGPKVVSRVFQKYRYRYKLGLLPSELFNPMGLNTNLFEAQDKVEKAYAIHMGASSWMEMDGFFLITLYRNMKILLFIIIVFLSSQILPWILK